MHSRIGRQLSCILCLLICCLLSACNLPGIGVISVTGAGTPVPTSNSTPIISSPLSPPKNQWLKAAPGVEIRYEDWKGPSGNEDTMNILRLDPHHIKLRIAYQPRNPLFISQWMDQEKPLAVLNGGYFNEQGQATGLVIANGQTYGSSYDGFGGMLSVDSGGHIRLRSLSQHPYDSGEQLQQATQSAPMLIMPGGKRADFNADASSNRRTVVAVDKQGRLLFIVSPNQAFSLDEFDDLLVASDLNIDVALNLDGGASTGMFVNAGDQHVTIDSLTPVPIAILIQAK